MLHEETPFDYLIEDQIKEVPENEKPVIHKKGWKVLIPANLAEKYCGGNLFAETVLSILIRRARTVPGIIQHRGGTINLNRGQCICGRYELAKRLGLKRNEALRVQRVLKRLEKDYEQIKIKRIRQSSIITVLYFDEITCF